MMYEYDLLVNKSNYKKLNGTQVLHSLCGTVDVIQSVPAWGPQSEDSQQSHDYSCDSKCD